MVDLEKIRKDLKRLRESRGMSTRDLGKRIGVSYAKIQAIEKTPIKLGLADFEAWLAQFDNTLLIYLATMAAADELDKVQANEELIRRLKIALSMADRTAMLNNFMDPLLADVIRAEKNQQ